MMTSYGARRLLRGITAHYRSRWVEWCLAGVLLCQSLQLLSARDLASNRVYHVLASMVHESTLGRFALGLALAWLTALALNGTYVRFRRISPWVRAACTLLAFCYWLLWSITLYQATVVVTSVSWINHAGLATMAVICFLWTAHEVAVADERAAACRSRSRTIG